MLRGLDKTIEGLVRDKAVEVVDHREGYTCEFSTSPDSHRDMYDEEEGNLWAALISFAAGQARIDMADGEAMTTAMMPPGSRWRGKTKDWVIEELERRLSDSHRDRETARRQAAELASLPLDERMRP